ncbi:MAG: 50S ribosomal protein L11 methyltransferase [Deltaproteobacteria bacterium]|nr:50S ribosomal protein L11 methyltransferase [Deltaproteobacteria bacterium]
MPRKKFTAPRPFHQLEVELAPRDLDLAIGLLYQWGILSSQTRRLRAGTLLSAELPKGFRFEAFRKAVLRWERARDGKKVFRKLRRRMIRDRSWVRKYQRTLRPFALLPASVPGGPWTVDPRGTTPQRRDPKTLYIEAGLAFGTGTHTTTRLAAEFLAEAMIKFGADSVLDLGCGTGILAMVARKLGAKRIVAVDNDPEALAVAKENFRRNGVRGIALRTDLEKVSGRFPMIVSNIGLNVLVELQSSLVRKLVPSGLLILTGLLYKDGKALRRAYRGLKLLRFENRRGWSIFLLRKA